MMAERTAAKSCKVSNEKAKKGSLLLGSLARNLEETMRTDISEPLSPAA